MLYYINEEFENAEKSGIFYACLAILYKFSKG